MGQQPPFPMELSQQQREAKDKVAEWLSSDQQVFRLFGYAGTGKTTIAKCLGDMVDGTVLYGAYTGKAALQLTKAGVQAQTIHRMIYIPSDKSNERLVELEFELDEAKNDPEWEGRDRVDLEEIQRLIESEKQRLKEPNFSMNHDSIVKDAALVVIDEVSMVGERMGKDLESFDVPILVLGDTAQLPPIKSGGYFTNDEPDYLLTEIHRQAAGSPVLQLATNVRKGVKLQYGVFDGSAVLPKGEISIADVAGYDQVLVGRNRTRRALNTQIREHLGFEGHLPQAGDRLVCLRNNYDRGLLNGSQWKVLEVFEVDTDRTILSIESEEGFRQELVAWNHYFEDRDKELSPWNIRTHEAFDFGYALTCHKAQGSQWPRVLVIDESYVFPKRDRRRWLYTAITRASQGVTIIR